MMVPKSVQHVFPDLRPPPFDQAGAVQRMGTHQGPLVGLKFSWRVHDCWRHPQFPDVVQESRIVRLHGVKLQEWRGLTCQGSHPTSMVEFTAFGGQA
nr:hypothetical protein [Deinococcus wulumuqiensis]